MKYFRELIKGQVFKVEGKLYIKKSRRSAVEVNTNKVRYFTQMEVI